MRTQVTAEGVHVMLRDPGRFYDFRSWPEVPNSVRRAVESVCPHASVDAGRLSRGGRWVLARVFVPHYALPFGEPEAVQVAADVREAVEGLRAGDCFPTASSRRGFA